MKVLVVARTRMHGDRVCVGGLDTESGAGVRLLGRDERNLGKDHRIRPGEIWDVACSPRSVTRPPHVEDVVVTTGKRIAVVTDLKSEILKLTQPWICELDEIFGGCLDVAPSGSAFLREDPPMPDCSTGFWIAKRAVQSRRFEERGVRYWLPEGSAIRSVPYVGMDEAIGVIPAGAMIRFSLARWADFPRGVGEMRCYLLLSCWYL